MATRGLTPTITRTYRPFGATFVVMADDERFHRAVRFALARYPSTAGLSSDLRVEVTARTVWGAQPEWPHTQMTETPDRLTLTSGASVLEVVRTPAGSSAELRLEAALLGAEHADHAVRVFVEATFWWTTIGSGRIHAVHSGLVVRRDVGLLLRGQSGAGKSTLTYACMRAGMRVVSDDWVFAVAELPAPVTTSAASAQTLLGYPWLVWLTIDAAARFAELAPARTVPHPGSDRVKVPVSPPVARRRIAARPDCVVFVEPSEQVRIHSIGPGEAHERFLVSALDSERGSLPDSFVESLLDRPAVVLGRGGSPDAAAAALDRWAADHASRRAATSRR